MTVKSSELDAEEVNELLDLVENAGNSLTGRKKSFYEKNKLRNIAILHYS